MLSSITARSVPVSGDPELARLLASASSAGWIGTEDLAPVAARCEWPPALHDRIAHLSPAERLEVGRGAEVLLRCFVDDRRTDRLRSLVDGSALKVSRAGELRAVASSAGRALLLAAALGLLDVLQNHGSAALRTCAAATCTQPVLRVGASARSTACSPGCANRSRVARHRAARRRSPQEPAG